MTSPTKAKITPQGHLTLILALFGVLLGVNLGFAFIWIPSIALIFYFIPFLHLYFSNWSISAFRIFTSSTVTLGGFIHCRVRIKNPSNSQLTITIEQQYPKTVVLVKGWTLYTITLDPLEERTVSYIFTFTRRGIHELKPLFIYRSDPLGFFRDTCIVEEPYQVQVIPARPYIQLSRNQKKDVRDIIAGHHGYRRKGTGDEFFSLREYYRGDSPRKIYWKGSAKRERLISKEFTDEVVFRVLVAIDISWTMRGRKLEYALTTLLELAEMSAQNNDSLGFLLFDESPRKFLKPIKSPKLYEKTARLTYETFAPRKQAHFESILPYILSMKGTKGVLVIFSDTEGILEEKLKVLTQMAKFGHQIIYCDLRGDQLGVIQNYPITAMVTRERIDFIDTVRERIKRKYQVRENRFRETLNRIGATYLQVHSVKQNLLLMLRDEFGHEESPVLEWMYSHK